MKKQIKDSKTLLFEMMHKVGGMPLNEDNYLKMNRSDDWKFFNDLGKKYSKPNPYEPNIDNIPLEYIKQAKNFNSEILKHGLDVEYKNNPDITYVNAFIDVIDNLKQSPSYYDDFELGNPLYGSEIELD